MKKRLVLALAAACSLAALGETVKTATQPWVSRKIEATATAYTTAVSNKLETAVAAEATRAEAAEKANADAIAAETKARQDADDALEALVAAATPADYAAVSNLAHTALQPAATNSLASLSSLSSLASEVAAHKADKANPHGVTAAQVGAYTTAETDAKVALCAERTDGVNMVQSASSSGAAFYIRLDDIYYDAKGMSPTRIDLTVFMAGASARIHSDDAASELPTDWTLLMTGTDGSVYYKVPNGSMNVISLSRSPSGDNYVFYVNNDGWNAHGCSVSSSRRVVDFAEEALTLGGKRASDFNAALADEVNRAGYAENELRNSLAEEASRAKAAEALLVPLSQKGEASGVATLDEDGLLAPSQLPLGETDSTAYKGSAGKANAVAVAVLQAQVAALEAQVTNLAAQVQAANAALEEVN